MTKVILEVWNLGFKLNDEQMKWDLDSRYIENNYAIFQLNNYYHHHHHHFYLKKRENEREIKKIINNEESVILFSFIFTFCFCCFFVFTSSHRDRLLIFPDFFLHSYFLSFLSLLFHIYSKDNKKKRKK